MYGKVYFEVNETVNSVCACVRECVCVYVVVSFLSWGVEEFVGHAIEPISIWKLQAFFLPLLHSLCLHRKSSCGYVVSFQ